MTILAHLSDPITSDLAAESLDPTKLSATKRAILELLTESPRTVPELTEAYFNLREANGWPLCKPDGIAKRTSDLHNERFIVESGLPAKRGPYGKLCAVWERAA